MFIVWRRTHRQFFLSPIMAFWGAMGPHSASYSFILRHRKLKLYEALWGPMAPQRAVMGEKKKKKTDGAYFLGGRQTMPLMSSSIKGAMNFYNSMKRRSV